MSRRYQVDERRYGFLPLGDTGVELKVTARVKGWRDPGVTGRDPDACYPPEGEEEREVEEVLLLAYGQAYDLTPEYEARTCPDLLLDVEAALEKM